MFVNLLFRANLRFANLLFRDLRLIFVKQVIAEVAFEKKNL